MQLTGKFNDYQPHYMMQTHIGHSLIFMLKATKQFFLPNS